MIKKSLLTSVSKPARYTGGELNSVVKDKSRIKTRFAFCFPDSYEIGMSGLGMKILYGILNESDDVWCERVFAPWPDMEQAMRENGIPLWALESGDPIRDFDIIGFTLQYELCYSNVLNVLDLAGIPLYAKDRGDDFPLIVGGGPCTCNAEPLCDFFDAFLIGEGEESLPELVDLYAKGKDEGLPKSEILKRLAQIGGVYVPSLYDVEYNPDGTVKRYTPLCGAPEKVVKRVVYDLDSVYYPTKPVMPLIQTVQDRIMDETYRGCPHGCRFCQANVIFRPIREKSAATLNRCALETYLATGYDEISLTSLSISDYSHLDELCTELLGWTGEKKISLALPSLRADSLSPELLEKISGVRESGLTLAPEAGTQRLRDVINKNIREEDLLRSCRIAFSEGRTQVKLYFMLGLPTETENDLKGIADVAERVVDAYYSTEGRPKRPVQVTLSVASFIPKPFTPFQWEPQDPLDRVSEKQQYIKGFIRDRKIRYNYHDAKGGRIEAVFARGDRRLGKALFEAHRLGIRFDAWDEYFSYEKWLEAFEAAGTDPDFYASRRRGFDEVLPWDVIDLGVRKEYLIGEAKRAYEEKTTPNCMTKCSACGASKLIEGKKCPDRGVVYPAEKRRERPVAAAVNENGTPSVASAGAKPKLPSVNAEGLYPVRLRFEKSGVLRYISHLDLTRMWGYAFARSSLPIKFSEGFNPHPKMVFASALATGSESTAELLDVKLTRPVSFGEICDSLNSVMPRGLVVLNCYSPERKLSDVAFADYVLTFEKEPVIPERIVIKKKNGDGETAVDATDRVRLEKRGSAIYMRAECSNSGSVNAEQVAALCACGGEYYSKRVGFADGKGNPFA